MRKLKYPLLAIILYFTYTEKELIFRAFDPCYALCSRHGEDITNWAYLVLAGVILGALLVKQPFCRYFCPLAAVLNFPSRIGLVRMVRNPEICIDCGRCDRVCDQGIPVSQVMDVNHARCTGCLACRCACPKPGAPRVGPPRTGAEERGDIMRRPVLSPLVIPLAVAALFPGGLVCEPQLPDPLVRLGDRKGCPCRRRPGRSPSR